MPEILVVWLVFIGDEEEFEPLQELDAVEGGHTQVEHQTIQHRKWEKFQYAVRHDRDADKYGHEEQCDTLFPTKNEEIDT